jgi:hypothetical protein
VAAAVRQRFGEPCGTAAPGRAGIVDGGQSQSKLLTR